jgi:hypothetical protein
MIRQGEITPEQGAMALILAVAIEDLEKGAWFDGSSRDPRRFLASPLAREMACALGPAWEALLERARRSMALQGTETALSGACRYSYTASAPTETGPTPKKPRKSPA